MKPTEEACPLIRPHGDIWFVEGHFFEADARLQATKLLRLGLLLENSVFAQDDTASQER